MALSIYHVKLIEILLAVYGKKEMNACQNYLWKYKISGSIGLIAIEAFLLYMGFRH